MNDVQYKECLRLIFIKSHVKLPYEPVRSQSVHILVCPLSQYIAVDISEDEEMKKNNL